MVKKNLADMDSIDVLKLLKKEIRKVELNLQEVDDFYRKELRWFDHLSDQIAKIGGSWSFIVSFIVVLISWIILNSFILTDPFDHSPFIMLNLILSCIAALQAPVILMSQNRAAKRDQTRVELDLEKDLRDLQIDQQSHKMLLQLHKDVGRIKRKLKI